ETGAFHWRIIPELLHDDADRSAAQLFDPVGPPLEEWQAAGQAHIVKDGPKRTVYHVVLPGLDFYLKQYHLTGGRARLKNVIGPSKARLEWERTLAVAELDVPTVVPLALGEP